ncbi:Gtr1/RagA G protein conserved region-domain-containing protein [Mrakia frigida]|uniref:Gtr1/RagA G protein conserved region-domain-containing protein n=1 Tax=Mrakia frigida TaxID=29902 RepID=UPI003FCBF031
MAPKQKRQKVLLMGRSGSGKTSMRQVIFSANYSPSDTQRLGATLDVESSNVRLLGSLSLNIWDCGGQQSYMDNYLATQRSNIFKNVALLIYVFDTKSTEWDKDVAYFESVLDGLREFSVDEDAPPSGEGGASTGAGGAGGGGGKKPGVYVLVHKMDLEEKEDRARIEKEKSEDLLMRARERVGGRCKAFGTSIWDESLYKAWSTIIRTLIPNSSLLSSHLTRLREISSATEAVLFERQTFLVVARSRPLPARVQGPGGKLRRPKPKALVTADGDSGGMDWGEDHHAEGGGVWEETEVDVGDSKRFEKISEMIKSFRIFLQNGDDSTVYYGSIINWQVDLPNCSISIEAFTSNTYCLVISNDLRADANHLLDCIRIAKEHFEELSTGTVKRRCPICAVDPAINYQYEPEASKATGLGLEGATEAVSLEG